MNDDILKAMEGVESELGRMMMGLTATGRLELLSRLSYAVVLGRTLIEDVRKLAKENALLNENTTHCQTRCGELLMEVRALRAEGKR